MFRGLFVLLKTCFLLSMVSCGKLGEQAVDMSPQSQEISAVRFHDENYSNAESRYRQNLSQLKLVAYLNRHSVKSSAVPITQLDFSQLGSVDNAELVSNEFIGLRDARFLHDEESPQVLRRLTWMYPDDGCYTRAEYLVKKSTLSFGKIFVFGDLQAPTDYAADGMVTWWYHVAPVIKMNGEVLVFDPAVNVAGPMPLVTWLTEINANTVATAALCDSKAYGPYSICDQLQSSDARAAEDMKVLLKLERNRLQELGFSADSMLGDSPPWK